MSTTTPAASAPATLPAGAAGSRRILILTASAGAGHLIAAQALDTAFRKQAPQAEVAVVDVLKISNRFFRKVYADGYLGIVRYIPTAMGLLYEATDRDDRRLSEWLRIFIQDLNKGPTTRFLRDWRPDLIANTHFLPAEIVAQMRRAGQLDCPQVTITTDFETHRLWAHPPTERYYTATDVGRTYLATWGVSPESILVTGIPVRATFEEPVDRDEVRARHGLDPAVPLVLLLAGGFGVGPTGAVLRELLAMPGPGQIVVIAGRNEKLRARLEAQARHAQRPVRIIGFTDRMNEWMRAADLAVTKPGGLTVAESLVCGLPLIIVNPIPGQESRNSDFLLEQGAALKVNNIRLLGYRVSTLLADAERLQQLRTAAARCGRPHAARDVVADALGAGAARSI